MAVHEVFAYLRVRDGAKAIAFYEEVFGAKEKFRLVEPGGRLGHAELELGGTTLMLSEEFPEMGIAGPKEGQPATMSVHLHVDDADALVARAVAKGATVLRPLRDQFYGERSGAIRDPFGHEWLVGHQIEAGVTHAEMQRRYDALFAK